MWESVLECGGGVGSVGKYGEVCLGKCVGVGRVRGSVSSVVGVWKNVGRGLRSVKMWGSR